MPITRYEAEDAKINGALVKKYQNGANNFYVDYTTSTGSWNQWQSLNKTLELDTGTDTIRLGGMGEDGLNMDYREVNDTPQSTSDNDSDFNGILLVENTTYQAEDAVVVGAAIKNFRPGATGSNKEYVDYINNTGDYTQWTVDVDQAGQYNLAFQYAQAASNPRTMKLTVNGQNTTVDFASTGSWELWQSMIKTLSLKAGENTIRLTASGDSGPNIDFLKVTGTGGGGGGGGGGDFYAAFNFQNSSSAVPSGYVKDYGLAYNSTRGYGWITEQSVGGTGVPLSIITGGRDRNVAGYDQRVDTFIHMEDVGTNTYSAAWEHKLANGTYAVTVSVGDAIADDADVYHSIHIEGQSVINRFKPTAQQAFAVETKVVNVTDGKLTIDSIGGVKTKLNFVEIEKVNPADEPEIASASPADNATSVNRSTAVTFDVSLAEVGVGVKGASLTNATVSLYETNGLQQVQGNLNTSGGGDTIIFKPTTALQANTHYTMMIDGATDTNGTEFVPYTTSFTTGTGTDAPSTGYDLSVVATKEMAISLLISPDNKFLYASTVNGKIVRWNIDQDSGALSNKQTFLGLQQDPAAPAAIIGIAFDPDDPSVLWVSHNASYFTHADDFTGQISKLHLGGGANFTATVQDYIVGLPRSNHDHMTNSLSFGPNGKLYVTQGGNTAMGELDTAWGDRPERPLTAAMLEINPNLNVSGGPINVQTSNYVTEDGHKTFGNYNPYAANAPVTLYATGLRNVYDHVWHSNGHLYGPDNGSAAGGVVPNDPATALNENIRSVIGQHDVLYEIDKGGYYGHPNASRGEYILRGGNPTNGIDPGEVVGNSTFKGYPVGVKPDTSYKTHVFNFGDKQSADGIIELETSAYGSMYKNSLLVARYSAGDDIVSVRVDASGNVIGGSTFASGLINPLDLAEHGPTGNIYVAEFRGFDSKITMISPKGNTLNSTEMMRTLPAEVNSNDSGLFGVHEAESAQYAGAKLNSIFAGHTSSGALDFSGHQDDVIQWNITSDKAETVHMALRYAMAGNARQMDVYVNDRLVADSFDFSSTGGWDKWEEAGANIALQKGLNTIRIEADDYNNAHIDSLIISEVDLHDMSL